MPLGATPSRWCVCHFTTSALGELLSSVEYSKIATPTRPWHARKNQKISANFAKLSTSSRRCPAGAGSMASCSSTQVFGW